MHGIQKQIICESQLLTLLTFFQNRTDPEERISHVLILSTRDALSSLSSYISWAKENARGEPILCRANFIFIFLWNAALTNLFLCIPAYRCPFPTIIVAGAGTDVACTSFNSIQSQIVLALGKISSSLTFVSTISSLFLILKLLYFIQTQNFLATSMIILEIQSQSGHLTR